MRDTALPTVKVKNPDIPGDFVIINQSSYDADPDAFELFDAPRGGDDDKPLRAPKHNGGGRWLAMVGDEPLKHDGGEDDGKPVIFGSKADAQAALDALDAA